MIKKLLTAMTALLSAAVITQSSAFASALASDSASNAPYQPGNVWASGAGGGFGFGNWSFNTGGGTAGSYIGLTGETENPSFGLFSSNSFSNATRPFIGALTAGQTFSIDLGNTANVVNGAVIGLNLLSGANAEFTFKFTGGDNVWQLNDGGLGGDFAATSINFSPNTKISFAFTYNGGSSYDLSIKEGSNTYTLLSGSATNPISSIDGVKLFNNGQGAGENSGYNNLAIVPEPSSLSLLLGSSSLGAFYFLRRKRAS